MPALKIITWKDGHSTADWFQRDFQPIDVEIPPLLQLVQAYFAHRGLVMADNADQALKFLSQ